MKQMKLLLYCTKGKPYLNDCKLINPNKRYFISNKGIWSINLSTQQTYSILNGTIPCECDYELEDIYERVSLNDSWFNDFHHTKTMKNDELLKKSCLKVEEMNKYFDYSKNTLNKVGYAIHIKDLHIFDKPKRLNEYTVYTRVAHYTKEKRYTMQMLNKAPQNMCYVWDEQGNKYALISIHPEYLCKILNGEKTIEVRRKVLKEML